MAQQPPPGQPPSGEPPSGEQPGYQQPSAEQQSPGSPPPPPGGGGSSTFTPGPSTGQPSYQQGYQQQAPPPPPGQWQGGGYGGGYPGAGAGTAHAAWWKRLVAIIIDGFILAVIYYLVGAILRSSGVGFIFQEIISVIYFVALWTQWNGQTLGNKVMSIRVQRVDGSKLELGPAAIRWLLIAGIPIVNIISGITAAFDQNGQGLHDKAANTVVVDV